MILTLAHADNEVYRGLSVPELSINWLAIIIATVVAMIIGSIWYGPLFGKKWLKLVKLTKKDTKDWKVPMLTMLIMALIQAFVVSHLIVYTAYFYPEMGRTAVGIITGFWLFMGVALPLVLSSNLFAKRDISLSYIEAGNQLVTLLAIGAILGAWA